MNTARHIFLRENTLDFKNKLLNDKTCMVKFIEKNESLKNEYVFTAKKEYGDGLIIVYSLMGGIMLTIYNVDVYDDIELDLYLPDDYIEIEHWVEGCVRQPDGSEKKIKNKTFYSTSGIPSRKIKCCSDMRYRGVSIITEKSYLGEFFGDMSIDSWEKSAIKKNNLKSGRVDIELPDNICKGFVDILECDLSIDSKMMFYESKVLYLLENIIEFEKEYLEKQI